MGTYLGRRNILYNINILDSTILMMHVDDPLAFCPITHILALAFADDAIECGEDVLTPDLFWKLKVPYLRPVLWIRRKPEKQDTPLFPHIGRDGHTDFKKPMSYEMAHFSLQRLGRVAGFRCSIKSYCFRRWVANETNSDYQTLVVFADSVVIQPFQLLMGSPTAEALTSGILGYKGKETYERSYRSKNASRNRTVQSIVLMRSVIKDLNLCQKAARMIKNWDSLAPIGTNAEQARAFQSTPRIAALHKKQKQLKVDIR